MVRFDGLIIFNIGLVLSPRPFLLPLLSKYFLIWQLSNYLDDLDDLGRETWNVEYIEKKIVQNKRKDKRFVRSYNIYRSVQVTKFRSVNSQPNDVFSPFRFAFQAPKEIRTRSTCMVWTEKRTDAVNSCRSRSTNRTNRSRTVVAERSSLCV